jgi:hypothetical protein
MLLTAENDDDDDDDSHTDERRRTADDSSTIPTWNEKLARFTSSWLSLAVSLSVLLVAFATQQVALSSSSSTTTSQPEAASVLAGGGAMRQPTRNALPAEVSAYTSYEHLGRKPALGSPRIFNIIAQVLTAESSSSLLLNATLLDAYRHDGVICLRGLLSDDLVNQLDTETSAIIAERVTRDGPPKKNSQFHTVEHSALFRNININNSNKSVSTTKDFPALLQAALFSNTSRVAAELLGLVATVKEDEEVTSSQRNLRVIRDIFLAKDNEEYTCGWHVDDVRTHE